MSKLRMCRFYEGEAQLLFGTVQQATNAFMSVLYLDLIGDYCTLYDDPSFDKKEIEFPEWDNGCIAPGIYKRAFKEKLSLELFEKIFKGNAQSLQDSVKYNFPISANEAWLKIIEYQKANEIKF